MCALVENAAREFPIFFRKVKAVEKKEEDWDHA